MRFAPDLHPAAMGIIDQEDIGLGGFQEVALGDVLPVAAVIGERQRVFVRNPDEALWSAAMLDIGLAIGAGGGQEQAVLRSEKRGEVVVDLGAPAAVLLDAGIGIARSLAGLDRLHGRGERHVAGIGLNV